MSWLFKFFEVSGLKSIVTNLKKEPRVLELQQISTQPVASQGGGYININEPAPPPVATGLRDQFPLRKWLFQKMDSMIGWTSG